MLWKRPPEYVMSLASPEAVYGALKMSINLFLPANLSKFAKGKHWFEVNGKTVGECLNQLLNIVPALKSVLFCEEGDKLSWAFKVLVNQESTDAEGLATKLEDGDEIEIKTTLH